ncbi:MAG: tyrosine-type recombinase/integrase [Vulcanimicrobiaceae bacterium]
MRSPATPLEAVYLLGVVGGFREGELFALDWKNINLATGTIMVRRGKTKTTARPVPIPPLAVAALEKLPHRTGLVFPNRRGNRLNPSNFRNRHYYPLLERAGLPRITFHDLRHTHATLLMASGVHAKVIQERLGHSSIRVTLDLYSHVVPTMQAQAVETIQGLFEDEGAA